MMRTFNDKTYRPLPKQVTIVPSNIDGLGLHAKENIDAGTDLGETHVLVHTSERLEWVRTPLGGFINHSDEPNSYIATDKGDRRLHTIRPIVEGEEITVYYRFRGYDGMSGDDTHVEIDE